VKYDSEEAKWHFPPKKDSDKKNLKYFMNKINLFNPFLHGFLHAVVVACVVTVIIWIHFVVAIFSLHINAQQVLLALFIGFLNTITCVCRKGVEAGFSQLVNGRCMILA